MKSQDFRLLEKRATGTDPLRDHEILFHVRYTGDPGRSFQPKAFCAILGRKRQMKLKLTALILQ